MSEGQAVYGGGKYCGNCGIRVDGECTLPRAKMEHCLITPGRPNWRKLVTDRERLEEFIRAGRGEVVAQCTEAPDEFETAYDTLKRNAEIDKENSRQEGMPCDFCSHHVNQEPSFCVTCDPENSNYDPYEFVCNCPECGDGSKENDHPVDDNEMVDHPAHYTQHPREVIDIIKDQLLAVYGLDGYRAYCWGNEIKYRMRAGLKGDAAEDIGKAMKYKEFREAINEH